TRRSSDLECCGATDTWTYTYTILPPVWTVPEADGEEVACPSAAVLQTPPTVTDNCDRPVTAELTSESDDVECSGTKTYTFTYTDCSGATDTWTYTYTILPTGRTLV